MTAKRDPERMVEGLLGDEELLAALRVARAHTPSQAQLEALALKVTAATAVTAAGASGAGGMAKLQALWAKVGAVKFTLAVALAGGAAYVGLRPSAEREAPPRAIQAPAMPYAMPDESAPAIEAPARTRAPSPAKEAAKRSAEVAARAVPDAPAARRSEPRAEEPTPAPGRAATPERRRSTERVRAPSPLRTVTPGGKPMAASPSQALPAEPEPREEPPDEAAKPASELELLHRAQQLIARDPEAALAVIEEHTAAYPRGAFAQERDALAIDALRRLGRRAAWSARARVFLERYPGSPHSERIRSWLR